MSVWPRQHGATVMFSSGLFAGWGVAGFPLGARVAIMAATLAAAFLLREPLVQAGLRWRSLPPGARRESAAGIIVLVSAVFGGSLLLVSSLPMRWLVPLAAAGGAIFVTAVVGGIRRQEWRWWIEGLGALGSALTVLALDLAAAGQIRPPALTAFVLLALFFLGSTMHLRTLLRRGPRFRDPKTAPQARAAGWSLASVVAVLVTAGAGWIPLGVAALGTVGLLRPLLLRGPVLARLPRVGLAESALIAIFSLAVVWRLSI